MQIIRTATAGTMESSDAYVEVAPGQGEIRLELQSVVAKQFGDAIRALVDEVLAENHVTDVHIRVVDRGALDCVIRARVETALLRGKE